MMAVSKIEFDFVMALFNTLTTRESVGTRVGSNPELLATLEGRRVFARNTQFKDRDNENKGKWCRGYIEAANVEESQVLTERGGL